MAGLPQGLWGVNRGMGRKSKPQGSILEALNFLPIPLLPPQVLSYLNKSTFMSISLDSASKETIAFNQHNGEPTGR